ncbi:DUF309 domain-containing protein [Heyndrickxia sporothermodurans]|uniref:DUF309 domain-containing protein n=3 Tax=Heyndrickxia sporothermodurans TaxID=46224 RepID=A0A150LAH3_9BACI|nr:DUF309 domain-containing protein [Heyndrickxia sporothermodurans]KYD09317.1 hypothetical protein B4102_2583 [Heyndrickxia sporothermodurans]MBL5768318.1 DUF309 domain-containing protein [Heyndrickxia sporothermodurans]MBL5771934.1 DUF309 domain-containing protein [Heyndrickxia sporothermodurans]MBL5775552.1 DUF309 domain-containing protein [Heyndrickxia sporothermodurans]MBL5779265.1 DUF309 domain-containing protein [Heyndrickxia sporothermodurans]
MKIPEAYIEYLVHFHGDRDYFECHELLEEHWKLTDIKNRHSVWVGLIQLAVSQYHYRRSNIVGAIRLMKKALNNLIENKNILITLKIDVNDLFNKMNTQLTRMKNNEEYESINIKINDERLLTICKSKCKELGFRWGEQNAGDDYTIIHRHAVRDRTSIEMERYLSAITKRLKRERKLQLKN